MKLIISIILVFNLFAWAESDRNVAKVAMLRGQAFVKTADGKVKPIKLDDWLSEGEIVQTKEKSFAKLVFTDKSTMNVGPNSELNINKFGGGQVGLVSVIQGQIRSQVTKDVLKQQQDKSKLIIKTKSAAMGVRGTDFLVTYSPETDRTNLITFEGNVAMAQINQNESSLEDVGQLEMIVSDTARAVAVTDGLYAGAAPGQQHVTIPTKISPVQFEILQENGNFELQEKQEKNESFNSVVPPGLSPVVVANEQVLPQPKEDQKSELPPPEGLVNERTGAFAPTAGGIVDLKTGHYIAPPQGSNFDSNAKVYLVPTSLGTVDSKGDYRPPEGLKLTSDGNFQATGELNQPPIAIPRGQVLSTEGMLQPSQAINRPPQNDVLGRGFFIPGNYFIDNRDISVSPNLNIPQDTKVKFNIQTQ
jgi:hypothetical protein